ncbi:Streptothricin hydrolase [Pseudovibrio axinellae]|uniref:Streptothricin hydrolase n=1 Tax=Pseudovibrio axinellae TaxID=989403 RepID=A0A165U0T4_9HYPH|nr:cysteine hydrolase family protein [Pseudovibrio axinellae]KZL09108.1 Streptothricin hydrolase [Pseudovibrio axinellae]SER75579.1 Nicotinamidase-related amidase [Pseudovibrio axinellae]
MTCLILIDWQKGFRQLDYWGKRNGQDADKNAAQLLKAWRDNAGQVVHIRHDSVEAGSPLRPELPGNEFENFAQPLREEKVYSKSVNSGFIGTTLNEDLQREGIRRLVLTGATTDHCVNTTARMAGNLGYKVIIASDACFTFERKAPTGEQLDPQLVHNVHLASLDQEFAQVLKTQDILQTEFPHVYKETAL